MTNQQQPPKAAQARQGDVIQPGDMTVETNTVALLNKSEIDQQIATAHQYPRSIRTFISEALELATLNERVAEECFYVLPRDGKEIEGPSARLAEIIASAWGNCRAGARVVAEDDEFITAQGVFHDLQKNVAITYEVKRRITNKHGKRYNADMIAVTGNAASSIALRNAILKGIPKAFWNDIYLAARKVAIGDVKTMATRRAELISSFQKIGIRPEQIFLLFNVKGPEDITGEMMLTLRGIANAIKDGDTTPEEAFPPMPMAAARGAQATSAPSPQTAAKVVQNEQQKPEYQPEPEPEHRSQVEHQQEPPPANEGDYGQGEPDAKADPEPKPAQQRSRTKSIKILMADGTGYNAPDVEHAAGVLCEWINAAKSEETVDRIMEGNSDVILHLPSSLRQKVEDAAQDRAKAIAPAQSSQEYEPGADNDAPSAQENSDVNNGKKQEGWDW